jgi:hypothetical protein
MSAMVMIRLPAAGGVLRTSYSLTVPTDDEPRRNRKSPALLATLFTLPIMLVAGLIVGLVVVNTSKDNKPAASPSTTPSGPLPAITVSAPPSNAATVAPCTKVLAQLPVSLGGLAGRVVHPQPDSPFVVAWGDPAVVLRCGVARPVDLVAGSSAETILTDGVDFLVKPRAEADKDPYVFTVIDRAVYVEVQVPVSYTQPPTAPIADAIAKALPAVCLPQSAPGATPPPDDQLCTHRP